MVIGALKALTDSSIINTAQGFGAPDVTTSAMKDAIKEWFAAYFRQPPAHGQDPCMRLAYTIVHKLDKGVFAEYKSDILDKEKTTKGAWMDANLTQLDLAKSDIMQWMLVGGEVYVKPVPRTKADGTTQFWPQVIRRNNVVILARDGDGRVTSIGSSEESRRSGKYYTLLEKRTVDAAGYLTIENKLFESSSDAALGTQVPLATLGQYAELPEWYTYPRPVYSLGLAVLRVPLVNCVDGSPDAVSVYEPAMQVIRNVDHMEHLHNKEFELGRHRIVAAGRDAAAAGRTESGGWKTACLRISARRTPMSSSVRVSPCSVRSSGRKRMRRAHRNISESWRTRSGSSVVCCRMHRKWKRPRLRSPAPPETTT